MSARTIRQTALALRAAGLVPSQQVEGVGAVESMARIDALVRQLLILDQALFDPDLKAVNDREGHGAGDRVLRTLVSAMRSHLRSFDPIVRFGGDEFVCGLGGADLEEVERRFGLILRTVEAEVGVGFSVGLATLAADETLDKLTARADAALLAAKKKRGA